MLRVSENRSQMHLNFVEREQLRRDFYLLQEIADDFYRMPETVSLKISAKLQIIFEKNLNNL